MAKRMKFLAVLLVAALCVTAGYLEMNERYLGLDDSAFTAFAALNLDNNQAVPSPIDVGDNAAWTAVLLTGSEATASATYATATGVTENIKYGQGIGDTLADLKLALNTATGVALPATFTPLAPVSEVTVTIGAANAGKVAGVPQNPFQTTNFDGITPASLTCYKVNGTTNLWTALDYLDGNPVLAGNEPTDGTWALFQYTNAATPLIYVPENQTLDGTTDYVLIVYIAEGGDYDTDAAGATITDPPALGAAAAAAAADDDDDDDDFLGCVANPAATLSLEWLLLCIAPALYWIRRRR